MYIKPRLVFPPGCPVFVGAYAMIYDRDKEDSPDVDHPFSMEKMS